VRFRPHYVAVVAAFIVVAAVAIPVALTITSTSAPKAAQPRLSDQQQQRQIRVLTAALAKMARSYRLLWLGSPGVADIYDYGIGTLWRRGIDGAGTTIAVIEGWNDPSIATAVRRFDLALGLPNPSITTIYPAGRLPRACPEGMVKLGSYGSCAAWQGELELDVLSAHLIAPYASILISATPADTQVEDDAASQVAPPEMMEAVADIAAHHLANVISISDGTGESTYRYGKAEIEAQDPGELTAAADGVPVLVSTGDCGVVQNLATADGQCEDTTTFPSTAAWDDSPWVTAVGGSVPNLGEDGKRLGPDPLWQVDGLFAGAAGFSAVFPRPAYQDRVNPNPMREVPDITMDATNGTSEAAPLLAGVLALATQLNHHANVGPINPALYQALGPHWAKDGIIDVVSGNDSVISNGSLVPGYAAGPGFDVASGWGTLYAPAFVPSLVKAVNLDVQARTQARAQLSALEHDSITLTRTADGGYDLRATGFLPTHPVRLLLDGTLVTVLTAAADGDVQGAITAKPGERITLTSMLITETATT
jgi:subtilase family serine protease